MRLLIDHGAAVDQGTKVRAELDVHGQEIIESDPMIWAHWSRREADPHPHPHTQPPTHTQDGFLPLFVASQAGFPSIIELLISHNAALNAGVQVCIRCNFNCSKQGSICSCCIPASDPRWSSARVNQKYGSEFGIHSANAQDGFQPLHIACQEGNAGE